MGKVKNAINVLKENKRKVEVSAMTAVLTGTLASPVAFAEVKSVDISTVIPHILGIVFNIFFYIGVLLLAWSIGMLVMAFRNEDADSKSRSIMLMVVSAALLGIKPLFNTLGILTV